MAVGVIEILGAVVVGVVLVVVVVNAWADAARGTSWRDWFGRTGPTDAITTAGPSFPRRDRVRVARALSRGRDIPPEDIPVATSVVKSVQPPQFQVFLLGFAVLGSLGGILDDSGFWRWLSVAEVAVLGLVTVWTILRDRRRQRGYEQISASYPSA